jgi:predicted phage terminase large subunit-like protein
MDAATGRPVELPSDAEIDLRIVEKGGLHGFTEVAWPQVQKAAPFLDNWHVGEICAHLEAVSAGEFRNLIINIPPGCSKSTTVAVLWPAWEWAEVDPARQYIFGTYSSTLSRRDAIRHRNLVGSKWFRRRWPGVSIPYQNTRSATNFQNNKGGRRISTSVKGGIIGEHGNTIVVDDPLRPLDGEGRRAVLGTELDGCIDWWGGTLSTRQANPRTTRRVIIMQRLNVRDLAGHVLEEEGEEEWVHLRLPMEFESRYPCVTRPIRKRYLEDDATEDDPTPRFEIGGDPRTEEGELIWPEHYDRKAVDTLKRRLGPRGTAAQLQQRPSALEGAIFKAYWIQYWGYPGSRYAELPERLRLIQSWDMTFKGKPTGGQKRSWVCGQVWGARGADMFLLDQERGQWELVEQLQALARLTRRWPKAHRKLIEDAANGAAVVSAAKRKVAGLKLVPTGGGSEARAQAAATFFEGPEEFEPGNVWLPHPTIAPWVPDYVAELLAFPNGANDDQVDSTTHAVVYLGGGAARLYSEAMANLG